MDQFGNIIDSKSSTYDADLDTTENFNKFNLSTVIGVIRGQLVQLGIAYKADNSKLDLLANIIPEAIPDGVFEVENLRLRWSEVNSDYDINEQIKKIPERLIVKAKEGFGILCYNLKTNYNLIYKSCDKLIISIVGSDYNKYSDFMSNNKTGEFALHPSFGVKIGVIMELV